MTYSIQFFCKNHPTQQLMLINNLLFPQVLRKLTKAEESLAEKPIHCDVCKKNAPGYKYTIKNRDNKVVEKSFFDDPENGKEVFEDTITI